jgi:hypothetical protein
LLRNFYGSFTNTIFLKEYRSDIEEKLCLLQATETGRDNKEDEAQVKNNEGIWNRCPTADDWKIILGFLF